MSWKEKMDDWGGGEISFLSEDGETVVFIVCGEPVLLEGKFKGRPSERIGCPIVTLEGFTLLIIGKRLARRLSRYEPLFNEKAFIVTRHGVHGDIESTYELTECDNDELRQKLFEWRGQNFTEDMVTEAVKYAEDIVAQ